MHKSSALVLILFVAEISAFQRGRRVRHDTRTNGTTPCNTLQLENRLSTLETQSAQKSYKLLDEFQDTNRRLQRLERHSSDARTTLEQLGNEMERLTKPEGPESGSSRALELQIDNLSKGLQVVVATLRVLRSDVASLKRSFSTPRPRLPQNCQEVQQRGNNVSGIYRVQPETSPRSFLVLCDLETSGGGWTYIHNRYEGMQDFYLNWGSYKHGFGNLGGEFWLGLEYLHQLTGHEVNELLVHLVDAEGNQAHAYYGAFSVGDEAEGYPIKVLGGYQGDAGDSLNYHAGAKFSTKDFDQDEWAEGSCAQAHTGGWWYKSCDHSNLNGRYLRGAVPDEFIYHGMYWGSFRGPQYSLLRARMMVRPRGDPVPTLYTQREPEAHR